MKHLELTDDKQRKLRNKGVFPSASENEDANPRDPAIEPGSDISEECCEFGVHLSSVEQWWQHWKNVACQVVRGSSHRSTEEVDRAFDELAASEGGTVGHCCARSSGTKYQSAKTRRSDISRRRTSRTSAIGTV